MNDVNILVGKTISSIRRESDSLLFECSDGDCFEFYHMQDCCESVSIHDIKPDIQSLVGQRLISVKEEILSDYPLDVPMPEWTDSFTWTIHTFETESNRVVVRWFGESNGYYSESVYMNRTHKPITI